jgi:hypothetical protein
LPQQQPGQLPQQQPGRPPRERQPRGNPFAPNRR